MTGGKVSDEAAPVHGDISTLGTGEGDLLGQEGRDLVLEMDRQVVGPMFGGHSGRTYLTFVGGARGGHQVAPDAGQSEENIWILQKYLAFIGHIPVS